MIIGYMYSIEQRQKYTNNDWDSILIQSMFVFSQNVTSFMRLT